MEQIIIVIHVIVAFMVVGLVLVQQGKGADVGAAFGSGSSNTMFGSQGAMPFLMKVTGLLAAVFFATNLTLSYLAGHRANLAAKMAAQSTESVEKPLTAAPNKKQSAKQKKQQPQVVFPSMKSTSQGSDKK